VEERENDVECWEKKNGVLKVETIVNGLMALHDLTRWRAIPLQRTRWVNYLFRTVQRQFHCKFPSLFFVVSLILYNNGRVSYL